MRILWVTDEVLDPSGGGGSIRQYNLVRTLAKRVDCDVLIAGPHEDDELRGLLGRLVETEKPGTIEAPPHGMARHLHYVRMGLLSRETIELQHGRKLRAAMAGPLAAMVADGGYDLVHFEHAVLAPLVDVVRRAGGPAGPACEITLQNLASVRSDQTAAVQTHWRHRLLWRNDARRCRAFERGLATRFERVIVVSDEDAAQIPPPVLVVPNGIDRDAFPPTPLPSEPRMLFSGSLGYPPNVDGALWFCNEILPEVRRRVPDARLSLVGRTPDDEVRALADLDGVDTAFDVPSIQPYVAGARVSVVPLRIGSGTRLKALEAMASGRPLAGTNIGLEGLGLVDGTSAVIRDDPAGLAEGIARLLTDDDAAERQRAAALALADWFDWERVVDRYLEAIGAA